MTVSWASLFHRGLWLVLPAVIGAQSLGAGCGGGGGGGGGGVTDDGGNGGDGGVADDGDDPPSSLPTEDKRVAIQSQCAQNVLECTNSWPRGVIDIVAASGQAVTETADGFLLEGTDGDEVEIVQLIGNGSEMGEGASLILYSWSYGATDEDPRTLLPGVEFSTQVDPAVMMKAGFHYIRLAVANDIICEFVQSPQFGVLAEDVPASDFLEIQIEVRDSGEPLFGT